MRRVLGILIGSAALFAAVGVASASAATVVVRPSAMGSWATQARDPNGNPVSLGDPYCNGSVNFVNGPASPPLGVGSAELKTGNGTTGGDCSAELRNGAYAGVKLSSLTALGYWTYDVANNGQQFPYLELYVNWSGGTTVDDALFFEPPYQTPTTGNPALLNQGATVMNEWQSWDALDGGWWANTGGGSGTTGCTPGAYSDPVNTGVCSLADYISQHPDATIVNSSSGGGVHLVVGFASPTDQYDGSVDAFRIATANSDTTYDFEPNLPPTTTSVNCLPSTVAVGQPTTCTATVTDTSGTPTTPTGSVGFASDSAGSFSSPGSCSLSGSGASASCQVTYTPSTVGSGTHQITASYGGDQTHASSSGSAGVTVTTRSTATGVSCSSPVAPGDLSTCSATVSDTDLGTPSAPTGTVTFSTSGTGAFSPGTTCTLSGSGASATCSVSYSSMVPGVDTITASYGGDVAHTASSGESTVTISLPATTNGCRIDGAGAIIAADGDWALFGLHADRHEAGVGYVDFGRAERLWLGSRDVLAVTCSSGSPATGSLFGTAFVGGESVFFRIDVAATTDHGDHTSARGSFRIRLSNGYDSGTQPVKRGEIHIRISQARDHRG